MTVQTAVNQVMAIVKAQAPFVTDVSQYANDKSLLPTAFGYMSTGKPETNGAGVVQGKFTISAFLLLSRAQITEAMTLLAGKPEAIVKAILSDETLADTVDNIESVSITFVTTVLGGVDAIGYRFDIEVFLLPW